MKPLWGVITLFSIVSVCAYYSFPGLRIFKNTSQKKYYSLSITLDSDSSYYLDSPSISSNYLRSRRVWDTTGVYDYIFVFDSVEAGPLTLRLESQLDTSFSKELVLDKDSTIHISRSELPLFSGTGIDSIDLTDLAPGEKICIGVRSSGCFHYYTEKLIIQSKDGQYLVDFFTTRQLSSEIPINSRVILPTAFGDSLKNFQSTLQVFLKNNPFGGCTSSSTYTIQKGNTVVTIHDGTCSDKINYYALLKMIQPDWFKEIN